MSSSLNRFGPDFRWPGLNNTPAIRHHLALVKRPAPKHTLGAHIWTDLPRMEPGPGIDYIYRRYEGDEGDAAARLEGFRAHRRSMKQQLANMTAKREALQIRSFTAPGPR